MADGNETKTIGYEINEINNKTDVKLSVLNCIKKMKLSKIACDEESIVKECLRNNVNLEDSDIKKILAQLSQENLISKRSKPGG